MRIEHVTTIAFCWICLASDCDSRQKRNGSVYNHRFKAQQKILEEQKNQLEQQQQQIEELHFLYKQQRHREKLDSIRHQEVSHCEIIACEHQCCYCI